MGIDNSAMTGRAVHVVVINLHPILILVAHWIIGAVSCAMEPLRWESTSSGGPIAVRGAAKPDNCCFDRGMLSCNYQQIHREPSQLGLALGHNVRRGATPKRAARQVREGSSVRPVLSW